MDWQPIETAPKDGRDLYLWGCLEDGPYSRPHLGSEDNYRAFYHRGFWLSSDYEGYIVEPTHWMPLPAPPSAK